MKPFEVRLWRSAPVVRRALGLGAFLSLATTGAIVAFAASATAVVVSLVESPHTLNTSALAVLLAASLVRAGASWGSSRIAAYGAARAKEQLRETALSLMQSLGHLPARSSRASLTLMLTRGLDALDDYFGTYLPQLLMAIISTPVLLFVIFWADYSSAIALVIVLPVIPIFMVLIGLATRAVNDRQWRALTSLGRHFLDLLDGLPTLKIFRREYEQARGIQSSGEEYRRRTMSVLSLSFLNGFVLELAATLSVAIVAVLIGTRLIEGTVPLSVGLFVLLLTPDVFAPIRQVGASFHAAAEGVSAVEEYFEFTGNVSAELSARTALKDASSRTESQDSGLVLDAVDVWRGEHRILHNLSAEFAPAKFHVIVGESGVGKSTLFAGLLGFAPLQGKATVNGHALEGRADERAFAWAPQNAPLIAGTVASNVSLGAKVPRPELIREALDWAAAEDLAPETVIGAAGSGLSGGQAQRVNLARAYYRAREIPDCILLLDEPSSALDEDTQQRLINNILHAARDGLTIIAISHRDELRMHANAVIDIGGRP